MDNNYIMLTTIDNTYVVIRKESIQLMQEDEFTIDHKPMNVTKITLLNNNIIIVLEDIHDIYTVLQGDVKYIWFIF